MVFLLRLSFQGAFLFLFIFLNNSFVIDVLGEVVDKENVCPNVNPFIDHFGKFKFQQECDEKLRLGIIDFGYKKFNADLYSPFLRLKVQSIASTIFERNPEMKKGVQSFEHLAKQYMPQQKPENLNFFKAVRGLTLVYETLLVSDVDSAQLKLRDRIKSVLLYEYAKYYMSLDELLEVSSDSNFDDPKQIVERVFMGMGRMIFLLSEETPESLKDFKEWCEKSNPIFLATKLLEKISSKSFRVLFEELKNNFEQYNLFENLLVSQIRILELLMANCATVQPREDGIDVAIISLIEEFVTQMVMNIKWKKADQTYWPKAARELVHSSIDAGGSDLEISKRTIHALLKFESTPFFFLLKNETYSVNEMKTHDNRTIVGTHKGKIYALFRSECERNEETQVLKKAIDEMELPYVEGKTLYSYEPPMEPLKGRKYIVFAAIRASIFDAGVPCAAHHRFLSKSVIVTVGLP